MLFKSGSQAFLILLCSISLSGCLGSLWTGATLIYDRHHVYKQIDDIQLSADAGRALYEDKVFKCRYCHIDLAVFNGDILLAGHVPTEGLRQEAQRRVTALTGYRRLFNQLAVTRTNSNVLQDAWITAKIRGRILADARINPKAFKVVTSDRIVYLMGDVVPKQAKRVVRMARESTGVKRVVKLLKYYHLSDQAA